MSCDSERASERDVNLSCYYSLTLHGDIISIIQPRSRQEDKQAPLPVAAQSCRMSHPFISSNHRKRWASRTQHKVFNTTLGGTFNSVIIIMIIIITTTEMNGTFPYDSMHLGKDSSAAELALA